LLQSLEEDRNVTIIPMNKEWGVFFIIMRSRKMNEALTTDEHIKQLGFEHCYRKKSTHEKKYRC
jgi:hypothetical protein